MRAAPSALGVRAGGRVLLALGGWVAGVLLHDPVTVWLAGIAERHGFATLQAVLGGTWLLLAGAGAAWVALRARAGAALRWATWAALVATWWLTCQQTRAEAVHLLQYGLLTALLWPEGHRRPTVLLALAAGLGAADELYQARVLYPDRPYDWNDVVLNVLGAVAGVLARWSCRPTSG